MKFVLQSLDDSRFSVREEKAEPCGEITRMATGYLAMRFSDGKIVKRFRLIDVLKETFGEENEYEIPK
jgi:hypothetical protein